MDIFTAVIIGIIQGLTEFLPVSSSAHLVFAQQFFGLTQNNLAFDVLLHLGTLVAVVGYFLPDIIRMIIAFFESIIGIFKGENFIEGIKNDPYRKLAWLTLIATIPVGIVGLLFESEVEALFNGISVPAFFLLITGCLLYFSQRYNVGNKNIKELGLKETIVMGIGQACAIIPGLSRSGTTIASGLLVGLDKEFAAKFSFILSIPAIIGAVILQLGDIGAGLGTNTLPFICGFLAAVVSGFFAIAFLLKLIKERSLDVFAYYCWIVGILILVFSFI